MLKPKIYLLISALLSLITICSCAPKMPEIKISDINIHGVTPATTTGVSTNTPYIYVLPDEYKTIFSQSDWEQNPSLSDELFTGNAVMDWYSDITFTHYLDPTLDSIQLSGGDWVAFDNYWSYYCIEPPVMGPFTDRSNNVFRDATELEIGVMIEKTHARNMKFALTTELNWDVMRGPLQGWDYQQAFWERSAKILEQRARELDKPTAHTNQFWDAWFQAYGKFVLSQAQIAQNHGADMLVIGKQIDGAGAPGNEPRWKVLIAEIRDIYKGPINYGAWTNQDYSQADFFPCEDLDYIIVYYYNTISDSEILRLWN
jgi:hypothetical protein